MSHDLGVESEARPDDIHLVRIPTEIVRVARWLQAAADDEETRRPLLAFLADAGGDVEARVPPGCALGSEDVFWRALNGPIRTMLRDRAVRCAGLLLPVELIDGVPSPCYPAVADGLALLAAQGVEDGAVSLAYYADVGGSALEWREIHDEAEWILTPLRGFVAGTRLELGESSPSTG